MEIRFEKIRNKFAYIDDVAERKIQEANEDDILVVKISINPVKRVEEVKSIIPIEYLRSCFN